MSFKLLVVFFGLSAFAFSFGPNQVVLDGHGEFDAGVSWIPSLPKPDEEHFFEFGQKRALKVCNKCKLVLSLSLI